jgi:hypothetical protein
VEQDLVFLVGSWPARLTSIVEAAEKVIFRKSAGNKIKELRIENRPTRAFFTDSLKAD